MNPQEISTSFLIATGHIRPMRGGAQTERKASKTIENLVSAEGIESTKKCSFNNLQSDR